MVKKWWLFFALSMLSVMASPLSNTTAYSWRAPATTKENTGVLTIALGAKFDCDYNDMITFLITWTSKATAQCSTFGRIGHCGFF
jgi:hypothetical protein